MMRASEISPPMFDNKFLDFFSRTHWLMVPALYVPLVVGLVAYATSQGVSLLTTLVAFGAGLVGWSLTEYWLHRTAFHWEPDTWWGPKLHFFLHGVHHVHHKDPYRLVMPPAVSMVLAVVFYGAFWGLGAVLSPVLAMGWHWGGYAGFVLGYVAYDCTHYMLHHFRPRSAWAKKLRAHHMNHHHNNPDRKFGVSNMFWDQVFGTI